MQILKRSALSARDIAELKAADESSRRREQVNETADSLQQLADKIREFWECDIVELTPAGDVLTDGQECGRWRQGGTGGRFIWYFPAELQTQTHGRAAAAKVIRGPWG